MNTAENYAKTIIESVNEFTKEAVFNLLKQAYIDGASGNIVEDLQLEDIENDDLQLEDFDNAVDGNEFLSKLS